MKAWGEIDLDISIHAPRVGSDDLLNGALSNIDDFNPRSPCGERLVFFYIRRDKELFQSTLPVWGATPRFDA